MTKLCLQNFSKNFQFKLYNIENSKTIYMYRRQTHTVDPDEMAHHEPEIAHNELSHLVLSQCLPSIVFNFQNNKS